VRTSNERQAILDAMREIGGPASPREIGRQSRLKTENVSKLLQKMARQGQVIRNTYGKYKLAAVRED
jgi:DNA-binding IclR family transcriptional regulator